MFKVVAGSSQLLSCLVSKIFLLADLVISATWKLVSGKSKNGKNTLKYVQSHLFFSTIVGGTIICWAIISGAIIGCAIVGGVIVGIAIRGGAIVGSTIMGNAIIEDAITGSAIAGGVITGGAITGGAIAGDAIIGGARQRLCLGQHHGQCH